MDYQTRILIIQKRAKDRLRAGSFSKEEFRHAIARSQLLMERAAFLRNRRQMPMWRIAENLRRLSMLRQRIERGGRVVAIDTGYRAGVLEEVGLAGLEGGSVSARNLVSADALYRIDPITHPRLGELDPYPPRVFVGGTSEIHVGPDLVSLARSAYQSADVVVWHTAVNDRRMLHLPETDDKSIDIADLSRLWSLNAQGLVAMCERFGAQTEIPHNSGNDALMTLRLGIAVAGAKYSGWERANRNSMVQHMAKARGMMKPTRMRTGSVLRRSFERCNGR